MDNRRGMLLLAAAAALFTVTAAVGVRVARAGDDRADSGLVDRLDYVFQERFRTTEGEVFGISRIPVTPEHRRVVHWKPDQELEKKVAGDLRTRGLAGAFLLSIPGVGSRDLPPRLFVSGGSRDKVLAAVPTGLNGISRPILLSDRESPAPLPTYGELLPGLKKSEEAFKDGDRSEFDVRKWQVFTRPIRATADCIRCHERRGQKGLQPGSVLGVAMYAFTPAAGKEPKAP